MADQIAAITARLLEKGVFLPRDNEWLNACVECFVSTNLGRPTNQIFDFVYEQWTLADLKDVGAATLPPDCSTCAKMVLPGKYAVQLNYFLDVSRPFHKQMLRIRHPKTNLRLDLASDETEGKVSVNVRALKIEITDGVTTLMGFEDSAISAILNPIPGEKAILIGPLEVRRGVLMLKSSSIKLLGGEVDSLLVSNAEENILARLLQLPINPDPYNIGRADVNEEASPVVPIRAPTESPIPNQPSASGRGISQTEPPLSHKRRISSAEMDRNGRPKILRREPDLIRPNTKYNLELPSHEHGVVQYTDMTTTLLDSVDSTSRRIAPQTNDVFPPKEFPASRKVSARVVRVIDKLQLRDSKWQLSAVVEAKGLQIEVDFSPEALDKIFTVSAQEITNLRHQLQSNPTLKNELNANLRESQRKIQTLSCEMELHFENFISKPTVTDVNQN